MKSLSCSVLALFALGPLLGVGCVPKKQTLVFKVKTDPGMSVMAVQKFSVVLELGPAQPVDFNNATACEKFEMTSSKGPFNVSSTMEQSFSVRFDAHKGERIRWTITALQAAGTEVAYGQSSFILEFDKTEVDVVLRSSKPTKGGVCTSGTDARVDTSSGMDSADRQDSPPIDPPADKPPEVPGVCDEVTGSGCSSGQKCTLDCASKTMRCFPSGSGGLGAACSTTGASDSCASGLTCACDASSRCNCYKYCRTPGDCPSGLTCRTGLSCSDMITYAMLCT